MSFAILGGIGAAIAEGAVAAGTAIGSAAGAIGSGLAAGVGEIGAGLGIAGAEAGAAGAAGSGSLLGEAAAAGLGATEATAVPVGSTVGGLASGVGSGAAGSAGLGITGALPVGTIANAAAPGMLGGLGSFAAQQFGGQILGQGVQGIQDMQGAAANKRAQDEYSAQQQASAEDARALSRQQYGRPLGGGKLGASFAAGGDVNLRDGDFILPADIVSAMGDGSTKAGAKFLDKFFGLS